MRRDDNARPSDAEMTGAFTEPEDEAAAIQRMLDDGSPVRIYGSVRRRNSRWTPFPLVDESLAAQRAAQRRAARRVFRVYCVACGRSTESPIAPTRAGRCKHCGGTMLVEMAAD